MGKFISFLLGIVVGTLIMALLYARNEGDTIDEVVVEEEIVELTDENFVSEYRLLLEESQKVIQEQQRLLKKHNAPAKTTKSADAKPSVAKENKPVAKPTKAERDPRYHYFDVRKGDEYITLHTSMHKDTVEMLFGKPHEVDAHNYTYSNEFHEEWTYKYRSGNLTSHTFRFVNGRLKDVTSY